MKTPKPKKLYNLELHRWDVKTKTSRHVETCMWNSPYSLCKFKKNVMENSFNPFPKFSNSTHPDNGYYYKIVSNQKQTNKTNKTNEATI